MACVLHLFFQSHKTDIDALPAVLADRVDLLPGLLKQSRAGSTSKKYELGFKRWKLWALHNGLGGGDILPASALPVALYLSSIMQSANTPGPVITAFYSIKWVHELFDMKAPTDSKMVINILEAAKRMLSKPVSKKDPITIELLSKMYHCLYKEGNLKNQRIICASLVAFSGFLRSTELLNIKRSDVIFEGTHMNVFIESSKTDKYRDGAWLVISNTGTPLCPVANLKRYIEWANYSDDLDGYLFCNLSATKSGYKLRNTKKAMSYTNLRDLFIEAFRPHVLDITKYGLHSLRAGGASAAANNGIKDRLFKRHGRWASETAKDGYIKDNLAERLLVSQALGL